MPWQSDYAEDISNSSGPMLLHSDPASRFCEVAHFTWTVCHDLSGVPLPPSASGANYAPLGQARGRIGMGRREMEIDYSWEPPSTGVNGDTRRKRGRLTESLSPVCERRRRRDQAGDGRLNDLLSSIIVS